MLKIVLIALGKVQQIQLMILFQQEEMLKV